MISFCLGHCLLQNHAIFYHQDAVFERNLFHNGTQTITLPEEMRRKQMNNDPNYNVIVFFGLKSALWDVCSVDPYLSTKPGFTAVDTF